MKLRRVVQKVAHGEFYYIFGRFKTVRVCYSHIRAFRQHLATGSPATRSGTRTTLFPDVDIDLALGQLRKEAVYVGLRLPSETVAEIEAFARSEPLHPGNDAGGRNFYYHDIERGYTKDGLPTPIAGVSSPTRCKAVERVVNDPVLRAIVREYLGYEPAEPLTLLSWNFASDFTDEEHRRYRHHVIDYHYDVGGFNFVYVHFYVLDTDRNSGAHVMMRRSHNRKPLRMLLGSAVATEADVRREFGADNELMIEGPAGTGFIQDTSCFHRATRPVERDRLMLAIRFH